MWRHWMAIVWFVLPAMMTRADDWPTWQHDLRRTGYTEDDVDVDRLAQMWVWKSPHPPQPAWAGPAKWDAYARVRGLPSMRSYDLVFHLTTVGDQLFFSSSTDDSVHALDVATGNEGWVFTTDAPVRIAPAYWNGRLYFGSDDGFAYCVDATTGELVWRHQPNPAGSRIISNGRFISRYPCRTGVHVDDGIAWFACGLLPWNPSTLCAVDAETGNANGQGCFVKELQQRTMEGAPALSSELLIVPQGRVAPQVFRRSDGSDLGPLKDSGGGSIVVVALDSEVMHGPGVDSRRGGIRSTDTDTLEMAAGYGKGNALVVAGRYAYMLTDDELIATDLIDREELWKTSCSLPSALIGAGEVLFAGGEDAVAAFSRQDGSKLWEHSVDGQVFGIAAAHGRLFVSTDTGAIYGFAVGGTAVDRPGDARDEKIEEAESGDDDNRSTAQAAGITVGPWLQFVAPGTAVVRWHTASPSPTRLDYWRTGSDEKTEIEYEQAATEHEVTLDGLQHNRVYRYVVRTQSGEVEQSSGEHECDTFFNYSLQVADERLEGSSPSDELANAVLHQAGVHRGMCLVCGCGDIDFIRQLVARSRMNVVSIDSDRARVDEARTSLLQAGIYGTRVSVHHVEQYDDLPFVDHWANLLLATDPECATAPVAAELLRTLRPDGGLALFRQLTDTSETDVATWLEATGIAADVISRGDWIRVVRTPLPGAGEWTHLYGRADNTAFGGEHLSGASTRSDLQVQWIGRPGPRYQADRNGRKPGPLSAAGRQFLQGLDRIVALDAYNGCILWSLEIPGFRRFNMPRDCGNWCADRDYVYAVVGDRCWRIKAETGAVDAFLRPVPGERTDWAYDWGYVAIEGEQILGSGIKAGTAWSDFWGNADAGWYDARSGPVTHKVCSDTLFARDRQSGDLNWSWSNGVIIDSTITVDDGVAYFVECRQPEVLDSDDRRIGSDKLWEQQFLVALDASNGSLLWERPVDTTDGTVVFSMAHATDKLVIVASTDRKYSVEAFADADGGPLWEQSFDWPGGQGDHGKAMSRPAIVGDTLYVRPQVLSLENGEPTGLTMPGGGCGTYACTEGALFFRSGTVTMWNRQTGNTTDWNRLRPDCWLSTIPAAGMLLSAEGGGGCSCGSWMETSIGFMPVAAEHRP